MQTPDEAKVKCDNCDWTGTGAQLHEVADIQERLDPGGEVPAGQCPECGALAYIVTAPKPVKIYRGVSVFLNASGSSVRFYAAAAGKTHWGSSYDTLRKKLDEALTFEPFDALWMGRDIEEIRVIGLDMERGEWIVRGDDADEHRQRRIKFYHPIYKPEMREELETHLGNMEQWRTEEEAIKEARTEEQRKFAALGIKRPDAEE